LTDYRTVSLSDDASAMMTVASDTTSAIWTMPIEAGEAKRIPGGGYDGLSGVAAAPDGRIVFRSVEGGPANIWIMNSDGSARRQLTFDRPASFPTVAPDGRSMVFQREGEGLWQSDLDGQNVRAIPNTTRGVRPALSNDGKSVLYTVLSTGIEEMWQAPLDGSAPPTPMVAGRAWRAVVSPDGTQVAFYYQETLKSPYVLAVMPVGGDRPTRTFDVAPSIAYADLQWTVDGKAVLHNSNVTDRANIWLQPVSGGAPRQVTHFADQVIFGFDRSLDGKQLIIARGTLSRDAVMIRNFR
jgi:Tol biopolymer transport system component